MKTRMHLTIVGLAALVMLCEPVWADTAKDEKPWAAPEAAEKTYTRKVKRMGGAIKKRLVRNRKAIQRSKHRYSDRSFSSKAKRQETSSKLREMHERAFKQEEQQAADLKEKPADEAPPTPPQENRKGR